MDIVEEKKESWKYLLRMILSFNKNWILFHYEFETIVCVPLVDHYYYATHIREYDPPDTNDMKQTSNNNSNRTEKKAHAENICTFSAMSII